MANRLYPLTEKHPKALLPGWAAKPAGLSHRGPVSIPDMRALHLVTNARLPANFKTGPGPGSRFTAPSPPNHLERRHPGQTSTGWAPIGDMDFVLSKSGLPGTLLGGLG